MESARRPILFPFLTSSLYFDPRNKTSTGFYTDEKLFLVLPLSRPDPRLNPERMYPFISDALPGRSSLRNRRRAPMSFGPRSGFLLMAVWLHLGWQGRRLSASAVPQLTFNFFVPLKFPRDGITTRALPPLLFPSPSYRHDVRLPPRPRPLDCFFAIESCLRLHPSSSSAQVTENPPSYDPPTH